MYEEQSDWGSYGGCDGSRSYRAVSYTHLREGLLKAIQFLKNVLIYEDKGNMFWA